MYIAELSCNHNQDFKLAKAMVYEFVQAGATAIKIQLYEPQHMTKRNYSKRFIVQDGPWKGMALWDLYERARTPKQWLDPIDDLCRTLHIPLIVSVFHPEMVEYCEDHGVEIYKIASPEVAYYDLIEALVDHSVIASCGLASESDIEYLCERLPDVTLMHCVSQYPAAISESNLCTLLDMRKFKRPLGLSDHSCSITIPAVAVVLGAELIEKHVKLTEDCLDASFSLTPHEFGRMVAACETAKLAMGDVRYAEGGRYKRVDVDGEMLRTAE